MLAIVFSTQNLVTWLTEKEDALLQISLTFQCIISIGSFFSPLVPMPKRSARVHARIANFGHDTRPAKKARKADKEDNNSQASPSLSQPMPCNMIGVSLP